MQITRGKNKTKLQAGQILDLVKRSVNDTTSLGRISKETDATPFRVLISTMLSARTRDPVTEEASARLFARFKDVESLARAERRTVAKLVKPVNFYKTKTKRIIAVAKIIEKKYGGSVPKSMEELLELPGVGRKTANCVLVYAFRTPAIPVDVHVHRISNRIGITDTKSPYETELELSKIYEEKYWLDVNELFVKFGQTICKPMIPRCGICSVRPLCNYYQFSVKKRKSPSST